MRTLGRRYRLEAPLGNGGMAEVWRARDLVLGRDVAVKLLAPSFGDRAARIRIRAEAQVAARLAHPNIAGVYDFGESRQRGRGRVPYIVMELVHGDTLAVRQQNSPMHWRTAVGISAEVAAALAAAHACGVVHRDIKPGNVMLARTGVKVVDFGIAAAVGALDDADDELLGTPAYVAPERFVGDPAAPPTDVYALGILLYQCLTGTLPWPIHSITELVRCHREEPPAPLPPIDGLPADVIELCEQCLSKDPDERPSSLYAAVVLAEAAGLSVTLPTVMAVDPVPLPVPPGGSGADGDDHGGATGAMALDLDTDAFAADSGTDLTGAAARRPPSPVPGAVNAGAEPAEPAGTVEPAEPVGTVEPAEPVGTAEPVEPAEPAGTAEPAEPADQVEPAEPAEPVEPAGPAGQGLAGRPRLPGRMSGRPRLPGRSGPPGRRRIRSHSAVPGRRRASERSRFRATRFGAFAARWLTFERLPGGRRLAVVLAGLAGVVGLLAVGVAHLVPTGPAQGPTGAAASPSGGCAARYVANPGAGGSFTAEVAITNTGAATLDRWSLEFALPAGQRITDARGLRWDQNGTDVTVHGSAPLGAGDTQRLALTGTAASAPVPPSRFSLDGASCAQTADVPSPVRTGPTW